MLAVLIGVSVSLESLRFAFTQPQPTAPEPPERFDGVMLTGTSFSSRMMSITLRANRSRPPPGA